MDCVKNYEVKHQWPELFFLVRDWPPRSANTPATPATVMMPSSCKNDNERQMLTMIGGSIRRSTVHPSVIARCRSARPCSMTRIIVPSAITMSAMTATDSTTVSHDSKMLLKAYPPSGANCRSFETGPVRALKDSYAVEIDVRRRAIVCKICLPESCNCGASSRR